MDSAYDACHLNGSSLFEWSKDERCRNIGVFLSEKCMEQSIVPGFFDYPERAIFKKS